MKTVGKSENLRANSGEKSRVFPYNKSYDIPHAIRASDPAARPGAMSGSIVKQVNVAHAEPRPPLILLVHSIHQVGHRLLREAGEVPSAGGCDPASLGAMLRGPRP